MPGQWPEDDLRKILAYHRECARLWKEGTAMWAVHDGHAASIETALAAHRALADRFLEQTTAYRGALGRLQHFGGR